MSCTVDTFAKKSKKKARKRTFDGCVYSVYTAAGVAAGMAGLGFQVNCLARVHGAALHFESKRDNTKSVSKVWH